MDDAIQQCSEEGCKATAIRNDFCANHAAPCGYCGRFVGLFEFRDGLCEDCRVSACGERVERYVGMECTCGRHAQPRRPHASGVIG